MPPPVATPENATEHRARPAVAPAAECLVDAVERSVLFLDALRRRGNTYVEHARASAPPLLKFAHELVADGRDLPKPCNYLLLQILPAPSCPTDPSARPIVVVDPRAGHGPGIGGFKKDSEVGVALNAGHPVYFVAFRPQPEPGQTLWDVMHAEAHFLDVVARRHPQSTARPVVIGNCQAGWAIASLAAVRPELFGPVVVVGSPMSYWAGGSRLNPMRYSGAMLGGSWLASFAADLGGGLFDGAHLVENFERLNPANSYWTKYFRLWSQIDTEAERFLEFERWWGGYFRMTCAEIETIVEDLFVGNRLARGEVMADGARIDLRNIRSPVVVFASWGDNITPPPQALNWIIDAWGDERAIAAAGRVIVYVLHESVGHLGIFVGSEIARKEHDQVVNSLDVIENLPPGLYEMKVLLKDGAVAQRWDALEPGTYTAHFGHRTMNDLRAVNPEGRDEEQIFSTVAKFSEMQASLYKTWVRPALRLNPLCAMAESFLDLHPLRLQRFALSDANPCARALAACAEHVRAQRNAVPAEHPGRRWEHAASAWAEAQWNLFRDLRDQWVAASVRLAFGRFGWGAWFAPDAPAEQRAAARAAIDLAEARHEVLERVAAGGFPQAVCRIVFAGMTSIGAFERRSLRLARLLARLPRGGTDAASAPVDWRRLLRDEARIAAVAPVEAINALPGMLPETASREQALAIAAAVMMIEPTLHNPRSEIIELLMGLLDVDPERVIELARRLTAALAPHEAAPDGTALVA